jgi:uncharacterized RDD family membrane protein YckC
MYCSTCGTMNENANFCRNCGANLSPSGRKYAGFWYRLLARFIDGLVWSIPNFILKVIIGYGYWIPAFIGWWLYFTIMESSRFQGTLGKMALGLQVTDLHGNRISFGRANGRFFASAISWAILCFGYFMAGWTEKKQGLHDIMARTLVMKKDLTGRVLRNNNE